MRDVIGACPLDCPDGCSWIVTVDDDGHATKLRGNPDHPFTDGGLCKKVNPWLEFATDQSRILHPLKRVGPKGEGRFERVSWDEALADIAARLIEVRDRVGGQAIWPYTGTGNVGAVQGSGLPAGARVMNALGASNHLGTICSISGHVGLLYTQGFANGMDPEDVVDAGTVLLWGANTLVTSQHFWPFVQRARDNGAHIVAVDPVGTRTAQRADEHIALLPGTDGALALGLCHAVRKLDGVDQAWIAAHGENYEDFDRLLDEWNPARAARVCGLDESQIHNLADRIVGTPPVAIKLGQGMQRHAHGAQAARTVSCLAGITGAFGQRGGGLVYSTGPAYAFNTTTARMPELAPGPRRDRIMTRLVDELEDPSEPVEALIITAANPVVSNPDSNEIKRSLSRDELFTVVIDVFSTPTTDFADYVLPSTLQHEQIEMNDSFTHYYLNWNNPAVEPAGEALSHTDIFRRLATALAVHDQRFADTVFQADEIDYAKALLDTDAFRASGITVESLRSTGFARLPEPAPVERFFFCNPQAESDGLGYLPDWRGVKESVTGSSYNLIANGSDWHINTVFSQTAKTMARTGEPPVVVCRADAERDGLEEGSRVAVGNDRGSFVTTVSIDDTAARPGVAAITKGWASQLINATVREEDSDGGHGAVYHDNRVTIRPA
ncbi:MAG: molybdopterin-dependent oxidoreductase [Acidimicrobiales bacterium]|nr:molybdopterin-dependent oxidoreductase [Acidimicrobiales bacterium]